MRMRKNRILKEVPTDESELFRRLAESLPFGAVCVRNLRIKWYNQLFAHLFDPDDSCDWTGKSIYFLTCCSHDEKRIGELLSVRPEFLDSDCAIVRCCRKNGQNFLAQFKLWDSNPYGVEDDRVFLVQELPENQLRDVFDSHADILENMMGQDSIDGSLLIIGSRIVYANDRLHEMLGYQVGSLIGSAHWKIYHADFQKESRERVKTRLCSDQRLSCYELTLQKFDGSPLPAIGVDKRVILDGQIGLCVRLRDVSLIEGLGHQHLCGQRFDHVNHIIGGVANDFNNFLMIIMGCAQLMFHDPNATQAQLNNVQRIFEASDRAKDLVAQVLSIARLSQPKVELPRLSSLVDEIMNFMRNALPEGIKISQRIETNLDVFVLCEELVRKEIAAKLPDFVRNVSRFNLPVSMVLKEESIGIPPFSPEIKEIPDKNILLEISILDDNHDMLESYELAGGPTDSISSRWNNSISPHFKTRDSQYGFQFKTSSDSKLIPKLSITFEITNSWVGQFEDQQRIQLTGSEKILLVDDEVSVVQIIKEMLKSLGYDVSSAYSSIEALSIFRNAPSSFDLVLTDMAMPKMTGLFLASELRKIRPNVPIIVLTGFIHDISIKEAKSMGINTVMTKPFSQVKLASAIRNVLDSNQALAALTRDKN